MKKTCASEETMKVAFINLIPAIIYAVVLSGQFLGAVSAGYRLAIGVAFVFVYMLITLIPYVSIVTDIASAVIFIGLVWVLCSKASSEVVVVILKIVTAALIGLFELSIAVNITMKN